MDPKDEPDNDQVNNSQDEDQKPKSKGSNKPASPLQKSSRKQSGDQQQLQNQQSEENKNQKEERKKFDKLQELKGLEISPDLKCLIIDHEQEKILFVCVYPKCKSQSRLCCGYCNTLHQDHLKSLVKITQFREQSLKARGTMNTCLSDFTSQKKRSLVDDSLFELVKQKQKDLIHQFENYLSTQYDQLLKLVDGNTENYIFEETLTVNKIGGFYEQVEQIFKGEWNTISNNDIQNLVKLHENYQSMIEVIEKLDTKRAALAKELIDVINEFYLQAEVLMSDMEQEATSSLKKLLDKTYAQGGLDNKLTTQQYGQSISGIEGSQVAKEQQGNAKDLANKDFHSTLFKESHAPKAGWRTIQSIPLKFIELTFVDKVNRKFGKYVHKNVLPESMDFVTLGPLENERGDVYQGQWRQGLRWGKGLFYWKDGNVYEGNWEKGKSSGYGRIIYKNGNMYEGDFKEEKRHGKGTHYHWSGAKYEGEWKEDLPHGRGVEYMINGDIFEGEFSKGLKEGKGLMKSADGGYLTGVWKENKILGKGEHVFNDKRKYIGNFKDDKKEGQGLLTWPDGRSYEGNFKNNKMHGVGYFIGPDGKKKKGEWIDGKRIQWLPDDK